MPAYQQQEIGDLGTGFRANERHGGAKLNTAGTGRPACPGCARGWGFFFSSRRRHTRWTGDWSSDVCSSDLPPISGRRRTERLDAAAVFREWVAPGSTRPGAYGGDGGASCGRLADIGGRRRRLAGRSEERRVGKEGRAGVRRGDYESERARRR